MPTCFEHLPRVKPPSFHRELFQQYPNGLSASSCLVHSKPGLENDILTGHSDHASCLAPCLKSFQGFPVPMEVGIDHGPDTSSFRVHPSSFSHLTHQEPLPSLRCPEGPRFRQALGSLHTGLQLPGVPPFLPDQFLSILLNSNHIRPCLL